MNNPSDAPTIYKRNIRPFAIKLAVVVVMAVSIASSANVRLGILVAVVMVIALGTVLWTESRGAIILSSTTFEYTHVFLNSEVVRIADVSRIEETPTVRFSMGKPFAVPGLKLVLRSGREEIFPIDFPARQEIVGRFRAMVAG